MENPRAVKPDGPMQLSTREWDRPRNPGAGNHKGRGKHTNQLTGTLAVGLLKMMSDVQQLGQAAR